MSILSPHFQAHLYLAAPEDWVGGDRLAETLSLLSPGERRRYERFRVAPPARAFAVGRALARRALSLYAEADPADWALEPDPHGRPRITAPAGAPALEFNLSHNDRLVACLVTGGTDCGVDVESPARRVDPLRIAAHSFGEDELRDLEALAGDECRRRFFAYWTLKEAYLKARGQGIAMRMDSVLFRFPPGEPAARIVADFASRTGDRPGDWQFALYRAPADQRLAVALRAGAPLETRIFRALPDTPRSQELELELLAASHPAVGAGR